METLNDKISSYEIMIEACQSEINKHMRVKVDLENEVKRLTKDAYRCEDCKRYFTSSEAGDAIITAESQYELVYSDCGYGDDDEYAQCDYKVINMKCPYCDYMNKVSRIKVRQGPSKRRWD